MTKTTFSLVSASLLLAASSGFASCRSNQTSSSSSSSSLSSERISETRTFDEPFSKINAGTGLTVNYIQGSPAEVKIEGAKDAVEVLEVKTGNGTLYMKYNDDTSKKLWMKNKGRHGALTITVTAPEVTAFDCSTGVSLDIRSLETRNKIDIEIGTGGTLRTGTLIGKELDIELSTGASGNVSSAQMSKTDIEASTGASFTISGRSEQVEIDASTGATVNASRLIAEYARVDASTGATVTFNSNRSTTDSSVGATIRNVRP